MNAALWIGAAGGYIAASLTLAYWSYRHPASAVGLMAAVAPLEKISFYAAITIKPFLILLPGFSLGVGLYLLRREGWIVRPTRFERILGAIWLVCLFSLIGAIDPWRGIRMWIQIGFLFIVAIATARVLTNDTRAVRLYFRWFFAGGILCLFYGLFQFSGFFLGVKDNLLLDLAKKNPTLPLMLVEPGSVVFHGGLRMVRLSSFFFDWNFYGAFLVVFLSLLAARDSERIRRGAFTIAGIYLLMAVAASWFLTFSRSAWLGGAAAFAALWWVRIGVGLLLQRYLSMGIVVICALFILKLNPFTALVSRWSASVSGDPSTLEHATYGWAALRMFLDHPILGIGLHNFATYYQSVFNPDLPGATAHSSFLALAAETGLVGLVLFMWLYLETLTRLLQQIFISEETEEFAWWRKGVWGSLLGIGVCAVFYHLWTQLFIWSLLGAAWALGDPLPPSRMVMTNSDNHPTIIS